MDVRELADADRSWVREFLETTWGLPVVSISGAYDPSDLSGFVAEEGDTCLGVLTYRLGGGECEVVTLDSLSEGRGVGTALLTAARRLADNNGSRLWLITTNENIRAIAFYQHRGMDMRALHRNFVDVVRAKKSSGRHNVHDGIEFRHAIEFSY